MNDGKQVRFNPVKCQVLVSDTVVDQFHCNFFRDRWAISSVSHANGHIDKLEKEDFSALVCKYDIISLSELKSSFAISCKGFQIIRSIVVPGEDHRGGVTIMFKNNIAKICF